MLLNLPNGETFDMPDWQDCSWRRIPCGRDECKFCGRVNRQRQAHIDKGEDPDDMEMMMRDVPDTFAETAKLMREDAERNGIDLDNLKDSSQPIEPKPDDFVLYNDVHDWNKQVFKLRDYLDYDNKWSETESAADLFYYCNTLMAKVYRQSLSRFELESGEEGVDADYVYTKYVLDECLKILQTALNEIRSLPGVQQAPALILLVALEQLAPRIRRI